MGLAADFFVTGAIVFVIVIIIGYLVMIFNSLVRLKNDIVRSFANIDVLLKQRSDELPNLVETVKGYMKHEKQLLEGIAKARASLLSAKTVGEKAGASEQISGSLKTLFAVAESYPQLRANENFLQLQQRISTLEEQIADRREFYNSSVTEYNIRIQSIPDSIVAALMGLKQQELFKATEEEKQVVSIKMQ